MICLNKLKKIELINLIIIIILGTILHFTFELSNNNLFVASFSAVNESTWEHLKLLFFPVLLTTLGSFCFLKKDFPNYIITKTKALLLGLIFIVVFFYTYTGILGFNIAFLDILSFFIACFIVYLYSYKNINNCKNNFLGIFILFILLILFIIFTFYPPHIGIFKDPITNNYGILKN